MNTYSLTWKRLQWATARECLAALDAEGLPLTLKLAGAPYKPGDILEFADEQLQVVVIRLVAEAEFRKIAQKYPGPNKQSGA